MFACYSTCKIERFIVSALIIGNEIFSLLFSMIYSGCPPDAQIVKNEKKNYQ